MNEQEIRARINAGNASDADFDWLIDNGIDVSTLGPKGQEAYKARQAARSQANSTHKKEATAEDLLAQQNPKDYINNLNEQGISKADLRDNIPDNAQYKDAIKSTDYDDSQSKNQSYKLRSIQDAYLAGDLDKSSRDYLIADTLSNFTRNLGRDMGNVAAAYSGGSVNNERDQSLWEQRNKGMAESALGAEQSNVEGSKEQRAAKKSDLEIEKANKQLIPSRVMQDLASNPDTPWWAKGAANAMTAKYAGADIELSDIVATMVAQGGVELEREAAAEGKSTKEYVMDYLKSITPFSGGIQIGGAGGTGLFTNPEKAAANYDKSVNTTKNNIAGWRKKYMTPGKEKPSVYYKALRDAEAEMQTNARKAGIEYKRPDWLQAEFDSLEAK